MTRQKKIRSITIDELDLLGLDNYNNLYWNRKKVVLKKKLALSSWQKIGAFLTVLSTVILACIEVLKYLEDHKIYLLNL